MLNLKPTSRKYLSPPEKRLSISSRDFTIIITKNHNAMPVFPRLVPFLQRAKRRYAGHPIRLATAALKTILLTHVIWHYGYSWNPVGGASMLPTFEVVGDSVIISRFYRRGRGIKVGDVVSFSSVVEPGESVIKRILGLEGDYVLRDSPESTDLMVQVRLSDFW
jgi:inner membrane protease subunit 1